MKSSILNQRIKKIMDAYGDVKSIDLMHGIDSSKSDVYHIDNNTGCLRFLYKRIQKLNLDELEVILGYKESVEEKIRMISTMNEKADDKLKRAVLIHDSFFRVQDIDAVNIDLLYDIDQSARYYISFINEYTYKLLRGIKSGKSLYSMDTLGSEHRRVLAVHFHKNRIYITEDKGVEALWSIQSEFDLRSNELSCVFSFRDESIRIGKHIFKIPGLPFSRSENIYLQLTKNQWPLMEKVPDVYYRSIEYVKQRGYVYLEPIETPKGDIKCGFIYQGNPLLEYYSNKDERWIRVKDNGTVGSCGKLYFRIDMSVEDTVLGLFIISTQKREKDNESG